MDEKEAKTRIVRSKCMADMLVWLGFEYKRIEEGYEFQRDWVFDLTWQDIHALKEDCKRRLGRNK